VAEWGNPRTRRGKRTQRIYGDGNWKKKKGVAMVETDTGHIAKAEVHWYEAHGIGKVKLKVKKWL
jgi:hypothetical protein